MNRQRSSKWRWGSRRRTRYALDRLNKRFTLERFRARRRRARAIAAWRCGCSCSSRRRSSPHDEQDDWLLRSIDAAFSCGASVVSLVPTRPGNGAIDALADDRRVPRRRDLDDIERSLRRWPSHTREAADACSSISGIWSGSPIARTASSARRDRLHAMNLQQRILPVVACAACERRRMTLVPVSRIDADVAIVGSGFAGSLAALALRRRGRRVVLVERGRHPRFAIGESSTPLANLLLEELADRYDLPRIRRVLEVGHVAARASGRRLRPEARLHVLLPPARRAIRRRRRARAAAAGRRRARMTRSRDTHWYRPDFDQALAREAADGGRDLPGHDAARRRPRRGRPRRSSKASATAGRSASRRDFVIDASGPRGFLHRALGLRRRRRSGGCRRRRGSTRTSTASSGGIDCGRTPERRPIPMDDAARASRVSGRLDLGAAVQQRHHERRRRADRSASPQRSARPTARRHGTGCSTTLPSVARPIPPRACRRCRSSTRRGSRSAARELQARRGRCCRRPPASSIRCSRPDFR